MESARTILVVGATGLQGKAFVSAAASDADSSNFKLLALTRNPDAASAKSLKEAFSDAPVTLVRGDLDQPDTVRHIFEEAKADGGIWGVFCVLAFAGLGEKPDAEINQGKCVADLASEYGVQHFVYSSADRGGDSRDQKVNMDAHNAKVAIETHVRSLTGYSWTILRPTFFMDNFDGTLGKVAASILKAGLKPDTKVQLIASEDIGQVGYGVLKNSSQWESATITVIGDYLTSAEMDASYKRGTGKNRPMIPLFLAKTLVSLNKTVKDLIKDLEESDEALKARPESDQGEARVLRCKEIYPGMQTFETWSRVKREQSSLERNKVSLFDLIMGRK